VGKGVRAVVWWGYLTPVLGAPWSGARTAIDVGWGTGTWIAFALVCASAAASPRGRWLRMIAAGAATCGVSAGVFLAVHMALGRLPQLTAPWLLVVWQAAESGFTGALIGLALAVALTHAHRSARRARRDVSDGTRSGTG
jgi:hypothetical protein